MKREMIVDIADMNDPLAIPELRIELEKDKPAELPAQSCLTSLVAGSSHHERHDHRHPRGIYSISVERIGSKICKCATALESCWQQSSRQHDASDLRDSRDTVVDYLELALYSAAEHVDDLEIIAESFFPTKHRANKSKEVRRLKQALAPLRKRIASLANAIKHTHGRFRIYELDFNHDGNDICLYGFFVEGFKDGAVGPHPVLHGNGEKIVSVTSFLWSILTYVGQASTEVERFLTSIDAVEKNRLTATGAHPFRSAAIALARLPLYSFDEIHPFESVRVILSMRSPSMPELESGIYGSFAKQWSAASQHGFRGSRLIYQADGTTRTFKIIDPKNVLLKRWRGSPVA